MAQLIKAVIDTQKNSYRSIGQVNAADDLELELEVKMNGQPIEFINPQTELLIKKSDNNRIRQTKDIIYQDGKFKIKVDEQGVTYPGIVTCQLVTKENGRVSTCLFYFNVGTSLDREVLQSISKVETLEQLDEYVATAFANLDEYEKRIIAGDETIRKLNNDMSEAEKIRDAAELERQETFKTLKENMNEAITNLESSINLSNLNEKERSEVFNALKSNLESIKQDLINLNTNVESEEEKRVQAEIDRVNKTLEIIGKLESTNDKVTIAEAERVTEFNNIKSELTSLKEALTTINNIANSNEEIRKTNENGRVAAEQQRVIDFEKIKSDNTNLGTTLTKKVDDKLTEIQKDNTTFKQEINEQYEEIVTKNNEFKEQMNADFGNAKTGYDGKEYLNVVDRLNAEFDGINQRFNDSTYLEYEGTNITADNSYYGLTKEMSVKGRLLQNLVGAPDGNGSINGQYKTISKCTLLKPDTLYTAIIKNNGAETVSYYFNPERFIWKSFSVAPNEIIKVSDKTKSEFTSTNSLWLSNNITQTSEQNIELMLLEGDHTNTPLSEIPYGEGIYSVGENEVTEDGKYKISWKSCGKNILSSTDFVFQKNITEVTNIKPTISVEGNKILITRAYVEEASHAQGVCLNKIYLNVGDVVRFKGNVKNISNVRIYRENDFVNPIGTFGTISDTSIFTQIDSAFTITKSSYYYFRFWLSSNEYGSIAELENCILTVNNSNMDYEPYQESVQELQLSEPLRSLPNGTADEITEDGEEIRRVGKKLLNGSEGWSMLNSQGNDDTVLFNLPGLGKSTLNASIGCRCDKIVSCPADIVWNKTTIYNCLGVNANGDLQFRITSSLLTSSNVTGLKTWLLQNPITVYYELAEPIIKKHNKNINLKTFEGKTHITSDNYLLPTISCKVPSNVQAVVMSLKEENQELNNTITEMKTVHEEIELENIETNLDQDVRLTMLELGVI